LAFGALRGEDFRVCDLLNAGAVIESLFHPLVVQHLAGAIGSFGNDRRLPAGYRVAVPVFGLAPDNLRFEPEVTCYHLTISVVSRPENRTSGTRRAKTPVLGVGMGKSIMGPVLGVGMGKSIMGAVICCKQHPRRGDSKAVPLEPRFTGLRQGYGTAGGRLHRQSWPLWTGFGYLAAPQAKSVCQGGVKQSLIARAA
jgi:hypothetical protein